VARKETADQSLDEEAEHRDEVHEVEKEEDEESDDGRAPAEDGYMFLQFLNVTC
jgi:hypothetical protein